ncbi:MAG: iron-containing alcohol dehydrogenase [Desulfuromusa sp.]|nr:iron-containing alcohol dehydrogenase [Desulfuromusa sp.]
MINQSCPIVPVLSGLNAHLRVGIKAKELGMTKVLVVYDLGVYGAGIVTPVIESLEASRIEVVTFDKVTPDPPDHQVDEGGKLANDEKVDGLVAVGGGSVLDCAKAINYLTANPAPINQWFFPIVPQGTPLPMIAIPTTAGTGSEGSFAAVITDTKTGIKGALLDGNFCRYSLAISDPLMYAGLPAKPSAYCGFDVLTHTIDSLFSSYDEPYAHMFAETAIRKVTKFLPRVIKNGKDYEARQEIAFSATIAGNVLNTNMAGNTHCMGHSIGAVTHLPHGLCVALPLVSLIKLFYSKWRPERVQLVGEYFGAQFTGDETADEIGELTGNAIFKFYRECGIENLSELNITDEDFEKALDMMTEDIQTPTTYMLMTRSDYKSVIDHMKSLK